MLFIPGPTGFNAYETQRTLLTGIEYEIGYSWNTRAESWSAAIAAIGDGSQVEPTPVLMGAKLFIGHELLIRCQHPQRPPGRIYVVSNDGSRNRPLMTDFRTRCRICYFEPGEALVV